jgi:hypothetical protein
MPALKYATPTQGPWTVKALNARTVELGKLLILADDSPIAMLAARPGEMGSNARLLAASPDLIAFAARVAGKGVTRAQLRAEARALLTHADIPGFRPIQGSK